MLLSVPLLRLCLIWGNAEALDRREHSTIIFSPIDAGVDVDTLSRLEIVKEVHLITGEIHRYEVGVQDTLAVGP